MQNYIDLAEKNGVELFDVGNCQFCGAKAERGIHECQEIFSLGFQIIDFSNPGNHLYRFFIVDSHTLQHSEIHGRWNNHFHLTRLHLVFKYKVDWNYDLSPKLSSILKQYKKTNPDDYLIPPDLLNRGKTTSSDVLKKTNNEIDCKEIIKLWAIEVYEKWKPYHSTVDIIAKEFLKS